MEAVKALSACFCGYSLTMCGPPHKKHPPGFGILPFELGPLWEFFFLCLPLGSFPRGYFGGRFPKDYFLFLGSSEETKSVKLYATTITSITSVTFL